MNTQIIVEYVRVVGTNKENRKQAAFNDHKSAESWIELMKRFDRERTIKDFAIRA